MGYSEIHNYGLYLIAGITKAIIGFIIVVSIILNFVSAIVGGIWLAILGNWGIILFGIIISFFMPFAYSILIMPGLGIAAIIEHYHERKNRPLMAIFGFLSSAYGYAILAMWILGVFIYFTNRAIISSGYALLFWSHAIMIGPLTYMASKEPPESHGTTMGLFFAQLSFIIFVVFFFLHLSLSSFIYSIVILGGVFSILQTVMAMVDSSQDDKTFQDMPEFKRDGNTDSISLGDDYMVDGEFDRAIEIYRSTLENDPENEMVLANLGYCYSQNGDYKSALGCYDMALKLDQFDSYNWYFKGICLYNLQDYENALSSYKTAIELDSNLSVLWYNRALTEDVLQMYDDAIESFRRFLDLKPTDADDKVEYACQRIDELRMDYENNSDDNLIRLDQVTSDALRNLKSDIKDDRLDAIAILRNKTEIIEVQKALLGALYNIDGHVRIMAAEALAYNRIYPENAIPVLIATIEVSDEADVVNIQYAKQWRRIAVGAIGRYGKSAEIAIPSLRVALLDPDANIRGYAAKSLGEIGPDSIIALQDLRAARQVEEDPNIREIYEEAIKKITQSKKFIVIAQDDEENETEEGNIE